MSTIRSEHVTTPTGVAPSTLDAGLDAAVALLRREQRTGDHWAGVLSSSALATAMSIVALHLADAARFHDQIARGRRWLAETQAEDGGWGDAVVDVSNINATSLALAALALTTSRGPMGSGERDEAETLGQARARLAEFGGWAVVGDPDRCTLSGPCRTVAALARLMDGRRIKRLRPEVILLPSRLRRTISTTFPAYLSIALLHATLAPHPLNALPSYARARRGARDWLRQAQGTNGSFEESAFLTSVIIMGLIASGNGGVPWLDAGIAFVAASQRADGGWPIDRDLETFDTDLTVFALDEAGETIPGAERVRDWLLGRQLTESCFPTGARPGGWAWAMPAGWPDADDTSYTLLALRTLGVAAAAPTIRRGARWLEGMQNRDGSWSTFVRGSRMPFDHDCPYITSHVLSALAAAGWLEARPGIRERALAYLARAQRYDGSFASIWFREATAGTASVLEALSDCDLLATPMAARARAALLRGQNDDGGWAGLRMQPSTAEETAWAVLALLRCEGDAPARAAAVEGARWLLRHQRDDGGWAPAPIGLYYSAMWYSDSYYAVTLPLRALARARSHHVFA
jgi:squalene-hopene/tetraprenyl-beta-curcumene cyclase